MNPRVVEVVPTEDYRLHLIFTNGEAGDFDCLGLLEFGIFQELKNINYFKLAKVERGTVVWPNEQDICPDTLYSDAVKTGS
jgi:hypothetical protein